MSSLIRRGRTGFPSPPGAPEASGRATGETVDLVWAPPAAAGGSGIAGYKIEVRTGGDGEFSVHTAHTKDPEPRFTVLPLLPMTWYEFRVSAINEGGSTGPAGPLSDPILTRSATAGTVLSAGLSHNEGHATASASAFDFGRSGGGIGASGRRRRSKQLGIAMLAAERDLYNGMVEREAKVQLDIERSLASMSSWAAVFRVREGRSPRDEDRESSRVLRDEAHNLRVLRHAHAQVRAIEPRPT